MTDTTQSALLPCPHCGGPAEFCENTDAWDSDDSFGGHWIACASCGASTNMRFSLMEDCRPLLAEAWNRRALSAETARPAALSDEEIEAWADGFISKRAFNRPVAIQIAQQAAKWAAERLRAAPPAEPVISSLPPESEECWSKERCDAEFDQRWNAAMGFLDDMAAPPSPPVPAGEAK